MPHKGSHYTYSVWNRFFCRNSSSNQWSWAFKLNDMSDCGRLRVLAVWWRCVWWRVGKWVVMGG